LQINRRRGGFRRLAKHLGSPLVQLLFPVDDFVLVILQLTLLKRQKPTFVRIAVFQKTCCRLSFVTIAQTSHGSTKFDSIAAIGVDDDDLGILRGMSMQKSG
jgi:hypothetical protein